MAAASEARDDDDLIVGINVTPLVDVVLVLLVVLMVTAGWVAARSLPVDLPRGATGEEVPKTLAISIDVAGASYLDGRAVTEGELRTALRSAQRADPAVRAVLAADGAVPHRVVVRTIDLLRQEGIARFAIDVRPEELAAP